ncbi:uncharacterized protein V6R79_018478 [Siganus canaliculatus]
MHRLLVVMFLMSLMVISNAQSCDPVTQYVQDGKCCLMCLPGQRMTSLGNCLEPQCKPCEANEYQDKHTKEPNCQRQKYCDPNKNFAIPTYDTKTKAVCECKEGFHCSTKECLTCFPHRTCGPGYGVKSKGNHTHDTVCEKCGEGTFSNETSMDGVCKKWTECGRAQTIEQEGTEISDHVCVEISRVHVGVYVCVAIFGTIIGVIVGVVIWIFFCRARGANASGNLKDCVESCMGEKWEQPSEQQEAETVIASPTEDHSFGEMYSIRTPVENDDEDDKLTRAALTDNGNLVRQENGKAEILSRQESQKSSTEITYSY